MAIYKVLRPLEHNHALYLPGDVKDPAKTAISGADGKEISVSASGTVELDDHQAELLLGTGTIPEFAGKPDTIEAGKKRAADAAKAEAEAAKKKK